MSGIDIIKEQIQPFINVAKEHTNKTFLLTEIGCGIAGFNPEEIAPLFIGTNIFRTFIYRNHFENYSEQRIKTFKGFDKNLICRNHQYEIGKNTITKWC